jgi:hypothetical protein
MIPVKGEVAESQIASWTTPEFAWTIEYSAEVMEKIRSYACDALSQLSHGGREVAGVLYGLLRPNVIRIVTWRPISCDYASGDTLRLSFGDRMNLAVQFEAARSHPELKDLRPVGWFVTHHQGGVVMTADDLEIHSGFFPETAQVTLVIHPTGNGRADAGFFLRETDGSMRQEASYKTFALEPLHPSPAPAPAAAADSSASLRKVVAEQAPAPRPATPEPHTTSKTSEASLVPPPLFKTDEPLAARERWLWAIPIALALGIAGWLLYQRQKPQATSPLAFRITSNTDRTAQMEWNPDSRPVRASERGEIDITDGGKSSQIALSSDQLHAGKMTYLAQSGDVGFELIVYPAAGAAIHESTRLIAPQSTATGVSAPAPTAPQLLPPAAPGGDAESQKRIQQLTDDLRKERARNDQLQNLVRILENRLGVQPDAPKPAPQP